MINNSCNYGTYNKLGGVKIHHLLLKILLISLIFFGVLSCVNTNKTKDNNINQTYINVNSSVAYYGFSSGYYITNIVNQSSDCMRFTFNYNFDEGSLSSFSYSMVFSYESFSCVSFGSNYFEISKTFFTNNFYFLFNNVIKITGTVDGVSTTIEFWPYYDYIQSLVDITSDNQSAIDNYINENNYHTDEEYNNYGNTKYQEGYNAGSSGVGYSEEEYLAYGQQKYNEGIKSVDITIDNQSAINDYIVNNNYHSDSEYNSYGQSKYQEGYNDCKTMYKYTEEEYLAYGQQKFAEGVASVDITSDNQSAINDYIEDNNYHTDDEYNNYGNLKYAEGIASVDITSDNQSAIDNYINENNYHTDREYNSYGSTRYDEGSYANYIDNLTYINGITYYNNSYFTYDDFVYDTYYNCYISRVSNIIYRDYFKCNIYNRLFALYNNNYYDILTIKYKNITYNLKCNRFYYGSELDGYPYNYLYNGSTNYEFGVLGSSSICIYFDNSINYDFSNFTSDDYVNIANIIQQKYKFCFKNYDTNDYYLGFDIGSAIYDYCIDNVVCFDKESYLNYGLGQFNAGVKKAENDKSFGQMVFAIVDAPFNVFRNAFDFEILGINLSVFLISIVSLMFISFVIKKLI